MRIFVGVTLGLGVGVSLWAATGNTGIGAGIGAGVAFLVVLGGLAVQRMMALAPPS